METREFQELSESAQASMVASRSRVEFNLARTLLEADRCGEARERLRSLLDSVHVDEELRPRLTATYDEAVECQGRVRTAMLSVESIPTRAAVIVSGEFVGLADVVHPIPLGDHIVTIQADGYESQNFEISAAEEDIPLSIGPVTLTAIEIEAGKPPSAGEWVLWGVGAAGLATGIILLVDASIKESNFETAVRSGQTSTNETEVRDDIDLRRTVGYIAGGVGLTAGLVGTLIYVLREGETTTVEDAMSWRPIFSGSTVGAQIQVPF